MIDIKLFQNLQTRLNEIYSFPSAIIDNDGKILTAAAWQEICTNFHRKHEECEKACIESDKYIMDHMDEANPSIIYHCPHGLVDSATPIIIDGFHYGNFFTGQFFLEEPDMDFFKKQADKYGFPEKAYLEAVKKVPVWSKEQLDSYMFFIKGLIAVISESGLKNLKEIESQKQIQESKEKLKSQAETLDSIFNSAPNIMLLADSEARIEKINHKGIEFTGREDDEIIGIIGGQAFRCVNSFGEKGCGFNEECPDCHVRTRFEDTLLTGTPHNDEEGQMTFLKDGEPVTFDLLISTRLIELDGEKKVLVSLTDITKLKETEKSLKKSREQYALAVKGSQDGIWDRDLSNNRLYLSPRWKNMLGYKDNELINDFSTFEDLLHPEDKSRVMDNIQDYLEGDIPEYSIEFRLRHKDGSYRWILARGEALRDKSGTPYRIAGSHTDITERKKYEQELNKMKKSLDEAQRIANVGNWEWDLETNEIWWSDGLYRIWGREKSEGPLDVDAINEHIHPDDIKKLEKITEESYKSGKYGVDYRLTRYNDKALRRIHTEGEIICDDKGNPIKHFGVARDVTREKKLESQLQQAQKMESIGTLAGGIAHDFNNILSPIMLYAEMAMDELPRDHSLQPGMKEIFKAGERARDLVKQILTFARKELEEKIALKASIFIKEDIKFLRSTIPTTININYHNEAKQDTILADPAQLNQIVMNLCTNAAHAMRKKGGDLEVTLGNENISAQKANKFINLKEGKYLKITVRDTGTGMSPDIINRIFEPYFTTKSIGEGTGLGLAITHSIAQNCGGDIEVDSSIGKGTSFHVYLPLTDKEIHSTLEQEEGFLKGNERILFVDDEKQIVDAMEKILKRLGYEVTPMTRSMEALDTFSSNRNAFDAVITDMTMPDMTGNELAMELKKLRPDIPIILCTGYSDKINESEAKKMGIDAYIMKPVTLHEMSKVIREVLDK